MQKMVIMKMMASVKTRYESDLKRLLKWIRKLIIFRQRKSNL